MKTKNLEEKIGETNYTRTEHPEDCTCYYCRKLSYSNSINNIL